MFPASSHDGVLDRSAASQAPRAKATSDARARVVQDRPDPRVRDYIRQDRPGSKVRDCIRPDPEVRQDPASAAGPDAPDPYKWDAPAPEPPDVSASPAAEPQALPEPEDEYSTSPPYLDAEARPAALAADLQDSV